ncbi:hypothetical protein TNCV_1013171 [Trichonephila clavipes]|uniref:Transposase n=1 Tax=Trichonephila clavipes TaxID=2585209 RepID=A0A8X6VXF9_TRICX|nr:hypothetical protein TNCV_1013171 [Trichonephila clavipes]
MVNNALQERQYQNWFKKYRAVDFDLKVTPRSGKPTQYKIKKLIQLNPYYMTREIAETFKISQKIVLVHLKIQRYVSKLDVCLSRVIKEVQLTARMKICDTLMER